MRKLLLTLGLAVGFALSSFGQGLPGGLAGLEDAYAWDCNQYIESSYEIINTGYGFLGYALQVTEVRYELCTNAAGQSRRTDLATTTYII